MQLNNSKQYRGSDIPFKMTIISTDDTDLTTAAIFFYVHKSKDQAPILTLSTGGSGLTITSQSDTKMEIQGTIPKENFDNVLSKTTYYYYTKLILASGNHRILNTYTGSFTVDLP